MTICLPKQAFFIRDYNEWFAVLILYCSILSRTHQQDIIAIAPQAFLLCHSSTLLLVWAATPSSTDPDEGYELKCIDLVIKLFSNLQALLQIWSFQFSFLHTCIFTVSELVPGISALHHTVDATAHGTITVPVVKCQPKKWSLFHYAHCHSWINFLQWPTSKINC